VKEWRIRFTVTARTVRVMDIASGYRAAQLAAAQADAHPLQAHRDFVARYPAISTSGATLHPASPPVHSALHHTKRCQ
jgi:hypothetical protein